MSERAHRPSGLVSAAAGLVAMWAAACVLADARPGHQDFNDVERGRYLTAAADCAACHTSQGETPFAGGKPIETPFGKVLSANITPDEQTGIGGWTFEQFDAAVRQGRRPDGKRLYPA